MNQHECIKIFTLQSNEPIRNVHNVFLEELLFEFSESHFFFEFKNHWNLRVLVVVFISFHFDEKSDYCTKNSVEQWGKLQFIQ